MSDVADLKAEVLLLRRENAKLRKKADMLQWNSDCFIKIYGSWKRLRATVPHLEAENAKLRELVAAFDWCTENFDMRCKCDLCPLPQSDALEPECEVRMHELGIESGN